MTAQSPPSGSAHTAQDFDARATTWDDDPAKVARARAIADAIEREVPLSASMEALEYGAGTGLLGFMLRHRFADLTLADVSDGMLEVASKKIAAARDPHVRAVNLDLMSGPPPASMVTSDSTAISSRRRRARPGSQACVSLPPMK